MASGGENSCPGDNTLAQVLDGAAGQDAALIAHLAACSACQDLVAEMLRDSGAEPPRYQIERLLGMGGMGLVVRARDTVLARDVALKVLWGCGQQASQAVLDEARMLARFAHPNIVTVHDAGVLPQTSAPFIAMELVQGHTLREWLTTPRTWRAVVQVFGQAARGLAAAHDHDVVHGDFKPANVLLDLAGGRTLVTDFGLARPTAGLPGNEATTLPGGTPRYRAPELSAAAADPSTDQYAFGVALHEALWGRHPDADDASCPAPGCAHVPARLGRIVARCVHRDPALRYGSMHAVVAALDDAGRRVRAGRWIAGVAVLGIAGAVAWRMTDDRCAAMAQAKAAQWRGALRPALAQHLAASTFDGVVPHVDAWVAAWATAAELSCRRDDPAVVRGCLDQTWATLPAVVERVTLSDDPQIRDAAPLALAQLPNGPGCRRPTAGTPPAAVTAERMTTVATALAQGRAAVLLGEVDAAELSLQDAIETAQVAGLVGFEAQARLVLAKARWEGGDLDAAFEEFSRASDRAMRAGLPDLAAVAMGSAAQYVAIFRRDAEQARRWLTQARAVASTGDDPVTALNLDRVEAWVLWAEDQPERAATQLQSVIDRVAQRDAPNPLAQATNLADLATFLAGAGHVDRGLQAIARSIALRETILGPTHPQVATARYTEATLLGRADRWDDAAAALAAVEHTWSDAYGPDSPAVGRAALLRAAMLLDAEQDDRVDEAADALAQVGRLTAPDAATRTILAVLQARLALAQGRPQRVRQLLGALLEASVREHPLAPTTVALLHRDLGLAELALGNHAQAERRLSLALVTATALDGTTVGGIEFALAQALAPAGRCTPAARSAAQRAIAAWQGKGTAPARVRAERAQQWMLACVPDG